VDNPSNGKLDTPDRQCERPLAWQVANNLLASFRYAGSGVKYTFITQRNFKIHTLIALVAIALCIWLRLPLGDTAIIGLTVALVMTLELVNTAIEAVVDLLVKQSYHELAKIAKDCAAGAVLISALASLLVAALLILPPLWLRIQSIQAHVLG
jgi:diacylglycerol kinase (ATP)